jgi:hypothetical protein
MLNGLKRRLQGVIGAGAFSSFNVLHNAPAKVVTLRSSRDKRKEPSDVSMGHR